MRRFARSRLFATTALISLAGVPMLPGGARADMTLDVDRLGMGWSSSSPIWLDEDGDHGALPGTETGIIEGDADETHQLRIYGTVMAGELRLSGGNFRLYGNTLSAGSTTLRLAAENGLLFTIDSAIDGDLEIQGQGEVSLSRHHAGAVAVAESATLRLRWNATATGDLINEGLVFHNGARTGNIVNNGTLGLGGVLEGTLTNNSYLGLYGQVRGLLDNHGNTQIVGDSAVRDLTNHLDAGVVVRQGNRLDVTNNVANQGSIELLGELRGNVDNAASATLTMVGGTLDGDVANAGTLRGSGTVSGEIRNTGRVLTGGDLTVGTLINDNRVTVNAGDRLRSTDGPLVNNSQLGVNGRLEGGLDNAASGTVTMGANGAIAGGVTNAGGMAIAGQVAGVFDNSGSVTTAGDVRVDQFTTTYGGSMTIGAGHTMTAAQRLVNRGNATINGTLDGNMLNGVGGTTALDGGTVTGSLQNNGILNANGTVGGALVNSRTLNLTGDLAVGRLENGGTADVGAGEQLTAEERIDNSGALNVAGTVTVNGAAGIQNDAGGTVTLDGAQVNANLTNLGTLLVNSSSQVNGDLTNRNQLTLDGSAGDVTLTVDGIFTNSGRLDGTNTSGNPSAMTIVADLFANEGGVMNNVNVIGDLLNRTTLTYDQDSFLDGNLTNDTSGDVTVSAALDVRGHDIGNRGDFHITTDADSSGALNNVGALTNEGDFTIDAGTSATAQRVANRDDGVMTVAGTLTSATAVENEATLNVSGQVAADLDNSGTTVLSGGTLAGSVTNSGGLQGNGTVTGAVANSGTLAMTGQVAGTVANTGTINQSGTLTVAGLTNDEIVDIAAGGVLRSTATVQNNDRIAVAGQLDAALQNNAPGRLTLNGGTVTGAVANAGEITGSGTISGALTNSGTATLGGRLAAGATNAAGGRLVSQGTLSTASLTNAGRVEVASGSTLQSDTAVRNANQLLVAGRLEGGLDNTGTTTLSGGTVAGAVTSAGRLTGSGTIDGTLANAGTASLGGRVTGSVTNTGTLTSSGTLRVGGLVNDEVLDVAAGSTLQGDGTIVNNDRATLAGRIEGTLTNAGKTTLEGGTLAGRLANSGLLTGTGTIEGTLANAGNVVIAGRVDRLENTGSLGLRGDLRVGALVNDALAVVASGQRLTTDSALLNNAGRLVIAGTLAGDLDNRDSASITLDGGVVEGNIANAGTLNGGGRVTGQLVNTGTITTRRDLSIGQLINRDLISIDERRGVLRSDSTVQNEARLALAGRLEADLLNRASGRVALDRGRVNGDIGNLGTLTGQGSIAGTLENQGIVTLGGSVDSLRNFEGGTLAVDGRLAVHEFLNAGTAAIGAGTRLNMADPDGAPAAAQNLETGDLQVDGMLGGALVNAGTLRGTGTITGGVLNTGSANWAGRIGGTVTNRADLTLAGGGTIAGGLINESGDFVSRGTAAVEGGLRNESGATARLVAGSRLVAAGGVLNRAGGRFFLNGVLQGDMENRGALSQAGTLEGSLLSNGQTVLGGTVTGDLIYDGGTLELRDGARIGRDFRLNTDYALGAGSQVTAGRTVVTQGTTLALAGMLDGAMLNHGRVDVAGDQARVTGTVTNNGTVDMGDGRTSGVLRVGGLEGEGTYRLDLNLRTMTADRITVLGGAARGIYHLEFDLADRDTLPQRGARVTLIDVDESFGSQNDFRYTRSDLPAGSERIVYSVQRADPNNGTGDLELVSQLNPAMGAIFGNVALVQSLIGSVVNRPTSPFVTSLAYDDPEKPCGIGSWGRVIGGHANASGKTDNGVSNVETEVHADYYGVQVGTDLACFDDRFGGWNMAFGALGGINRGSTSQPVYAIDPRNALDLTSILTSYTSTDFEQRYAGIYATATKGRFQADLQYRLERTDFTISNDPLPGYTGLGLDETDFSSDAQTLSGSISYGIPIGDSGWAVLPTMGFAWSKLSTDSIRFDEDYTLVFKDSTRKIGFAGATLAKTFVDNGRNSALYAFATGTWYKDFADPTISLFASEENTETLTTENLGSYGEISVGANWIKVLGPKARGRQVSTGARIDARFGDQLDSVGVSGQFRWQF
ncbi:hypothetical protein SAMN04488021_11326 [Paracoccus aminovorans]|uniref:Autotransporter domain-containing protein n=2 Tax=Paracoccus aminovorans TaxID=34004 RepID=A0A1I3A7Z8_9RHOB|nr:outer membrane autotransporter barrel domain protein [Paracoccus aminovorans]SFH46252.1 hypothetical protein SAMN04488021_11326 [Paracoccus aminovorans]